MAEAKDQRKDLVTKYGVTPHMALLKNKSYIDLRSQWQMWINAESVVHKRSTVYRETRPDFLERREAQKTAVARKENMRLPARDFIPTDLSPDQFDLFIKGVLVQPMWEGFRSQEAPETREKDLQNIHSVLHNTSTLKKLKSPPQKELEGMTDKELANGFYRGFLELPKKLKDRVKKAEGVINKERKQRIRASRKRNRDRSRSAERERQRSRSVSKERVKKERAKKASKQKESKEKREKRKLWNAVKKAALEDALPILNEMTKNFDVEPIDVTTNLPDLEAIDEDEIPAGEFLSTFDKSEQDDCPGSLSKWIAKRSLGCKTTMWTLRWLTSYFRQHGKLNTFNYMKIKCVSGPEDGVDIVPNTTRIAVEMAGDPSDRKYQGYIPLTQERLDSLLKCKFNFAKFVETEKDKEPKHCARIVEEAGTVAYKRTKKISMENVGACRMTVGVYLPKAPTKRILLRSLSQEDLKGISLAKFIVTKRKSAVQAK